MDQEAKEKEIRKHLADVEWSVSLNKSFKKDARFSCTYMTIERTSEWKRWLCPRSSDVIILRPLDSSDEQTIGGIRSLMNTTLMKYKQVPEKKIICETPNSQRECTDQAKVLKGLWISW
jgi:hypothetical protein